MYGKFHRFFLYNLCFFIFQRFGGSSSRFLISTFFAPSAFFLEQGFAWRFFALLSTEKREKKKYY